MLKNELFVSKICKKLRIAGSPANRPLFGFWLLDARLQIFELLYLTNCYNFLKRALSALTLSMNLSSKNDSKVLFLSLIRVFTSIVHFKT